MAQQNLTDEQLTKYLLKLRDVVNPEKNPSDLIFKIFGVFLCLVADDYPKRTEDYLKVLRKMFDSTKPELKLVKS